MFQLSVAGRPKDLPTSHTDSHQVKRGGWKGGGGALSKSTEKDQRASLQPDTLEVLCVQQLFNKKARLELYSIFASAANGQWEYSVGG
jgi:hypothetical protein